MSAQPNTPSAQSSPALLLVRGLPGSGRTTLAEMLAGDHGAKVDPERSLLPGLSPLTPVGMAQVEADSLIDVGLLMRIRSPLIVLEGTFAQKYTMRPIARLAVDAGYEVAVREPNTDWAHDPVNCAAHSSRHLPASEYQRVARMWESDTELTAILSSASPSERLREAKALLAEVNALQETGTGDAAVDKLLALEERYPRELAHLSFLGYLHPENQPHARRALNQALRERAVAPPSLSSALNADFASQSAAIFGEAKVVVGTATVEKGQPAVSGPAGSTPEP